MKINVLQIESSELSKCIHQAALDPHLDNQSLDLICESTNYFNFSGLCTSLTHLPYLRKKLNSSSKTKLIALIGFPFGTNPNNFKIKEAEWAESQGADELEIVPNFYALHQGKENTFAEEIARICEIGLPVRAILDSNKLTHQKLSLAIEASIEAGAEGIQSGNGFGAPVTGKIIGSLAELSRGRCSIKAVGGIKTLDHALEIIQMGASHIGTSSAIEILEDLKNKEQ